MISLVSQMQIASPIEYSSWAVVKGAESPNLFPMLPFPLLRLARANGEVKAAPILLPSALDKREGRRGGGKGTIKGILPAAIHFADFLFEYLHECNFKT